MDYADGVAAVAPAKKAPELKAEAGLEPAATDAKWLMGPMALLDMKFCPAKFP